jgi:hypothetical protein
MSLAVFKNQYRLFFGFASAFVVNALLYVLSLSVAGFIFGTNGVDVAFLILICMSCSLLGLAVLRKFTCPWSWGLSAAYSAIGLFLLFVFTLLASTIGGHGRTLRSETIVGMTLLQGVAFVLPAILWGGRILAGADPHRNGPH